MTLCVSKGKISVRCERMVTVTSVCLDSGLSLMTSVEEDFLIWNCMNSNERVILFERAYWIVSRA